MVVDSVASIEYCFNKWYKLRDIMNGRVRLPSEGCYVYAFRLDRRFGRLRGESDILYFGCTKKCQGLNQRIKENYLEGKGGRTTQRIHRYLFEYGYLEHVEIAWIRVGSEEEAKVKESEFLKLYEEQHHELPPWNRQGG